MPMRRCAQHDDHSFSTSSKKPYRRSPPAERAESSTNDPLIACWAQNVKLAPSPRIALAVRTRSVPPRCTPRRFGNFLRRGESSAEVFEHPANKTLEQREPKRRTINVSKPGVDPKVKTLFPVSSATTLVRSS
jgi:hypothetical protein